MRKPAEIELRDARSFMLLRLIVVNDIVKDRTQDISAAILFHGGKCHVGVSAAARHRAHETLQAAEAGCEVGRYRSVSSLVRYAAIARMPRRPSFASASGL